MSIDVRAISTKSEHGTANLANRNFAQLWQAMGFDPGEEMCGEIDPHTLARECTRMLNRPRRATSETVVSGGPGTGTAQMIECGLDTDYVQRRARDLMAVAHEAVALGTKVEWF